MDSPAYALPGARALYQVDQPRALNLQESLPLNFGADPAIPPLGKLFDGNIPDQDKLREAAKHLLFAQKGVLLSQLHIQLDLGEPMMTKDFGTLGLPTIRYKLNAQFPGDVSLKVVQNRGISISGWRTDIHPQIIYTADPAATATVVIHVPASAFLRFRRGV